MPFSLHNQAMKYKLGTKHMIMNNQYEPQRTNNFELQIVGLDGLTYLKSAGNGEYNVSLASVINTGEATNRDALSNKIPSPANYLKLSVKSFDAPNISVSNIEVAYANNKTKFAGVPSFEGGSVTFNDFLGIDTERILMGWFKQVYNPISQRIGRATDYKKVAFMIEYDPTGEFYRAWQLNGLWIASIQLGNFSQDSNNVREISCNFNYDNCFPIDYVDYTTVCKQAGKYGYVNQA